MAAAAAAAATEPGPVAAASPASSSGAASPAGFGDEGDGFGDDPAPELDVNARPALGGGPADLVNLGAQVGLPQGLTPELLGYNIMQGSGDIARQPMWHLPQAIMWLASFHRQVCEEEDIPLHSYLNEEYPQALHMAQKAVAKCLRPVPPNEEEKGAGPGKCKGKGKSKQPAGLGGRPPPGTTWILAATPWVQEEVDALPPCDFQPNADKVCHSIPIMFSPLRTPAPFNLPAPCKYLRLHGCIRKLRCKEVSIHTYIYILDIHDIIIVIATIYYY